MGKSLGSQIVCGVTPLSLAIDDWISGGHCDMTMHSPWKYQEYEAFSRGRRIERLCWREEPKRMQ